MEKEKLTGEEFEALFSGTESNDTEGYSSDTEEKVFKNINIIIKIIFN